VVTGTLLELSMKAIKCEKGEQKNNAKWGPSESSFLTLNFIFMKNPFNALKWQFAHYNVQLFRVLDNANLVVIL